ncbi:hypothetical protein [Parahaliea mediterranea]|uniref:hypothetical protein n=1 Tax=Parahaliea mediterranea TaxID=651086 RepID=UPI0019D44E96|nr:hypothetical protein [Parahaliea mediterranea]
MLQKMKGLFAGALAVAAFALAVGCSNKEGSEEGAAERDALAPAQEEALVQRVTGRWAALSALNYDQAWEYSSPAYRKIFPKRLFVRNFSYVVERELTGVQVLNYDAGAAVASVSVRVMSRPTKTTSEASRALGALPVTILEKWILEDGEWWYSVSGR